MVTNKEAVFECEVKINYPEISLSWYKATQKLDSNNQYEISIVGDRHILKIKKCQSKDQGNYRVVCGPHISSAKLTVTGRIYLCLVFMSIHVLNSKGSSLALPFLSDEDVSHPGKGSY